MNPDRETIFQAALYRTVVTILSLLTGAVISLTRRYLYVTLLVEPGGLSEQADS